MIEKLTRNQFFEELKGSRGYFIQSVFNVRLEDVIARINQYYEGNLEINAIYRGLYIISSNNRIKAITSDGKVSYRSFGNKNRLYKYRDFLIHESEYEDGGNCIMINL